MPETFEVVVNGDVVRVEPGTSAAAAILMAGHGACRKSVGGEPRAPLCGMGVCFECRAEVDGVRHVRTCQALCRAGMRIITDGI
ncbi:MAG TPA: 2Fe-2S iron-sulfur cluster-binding protein [Bryobacteraceae bacterium]|jgi:sarcosine oxidase subunit alpha|nr:2Fe-2S iron-sulfur cluster-binding protein [Bryobacteraceae bacterium]